MRVACGGRSLLRTGLGKLYFGHCERYFGWDLFAIQTACVSRCSNQPRTTQIVHSLLNTITNAHLMHHLHPLASPPPLSLSLKTATSKTPPPSLPSPLSLHIHIPIPITPHPPPPFLLQLHNPSTPAPSSPLPSTASLPAARSSPPPSYPSCLSAPRLSFSVSSRSTSSRAGGSGSGLGRLGPICA